MPEQMNKLKTILIRPWPLWSCLISGGLAELLHCPTIWGGGNRFISYAIPFPVASGTFHVPALVATTLLLYAHLAQPARWQSTALLCLLAFGCGIIILAVVAEIRHASMQVGPGSTPDFTHVRQIFVWLVADPLMAFGITKIPQEKAQQTHAEPTSEPARSAGPEEADA